MKKLIYVFMVILGLLFMTACIEEATDYSEELYDDTSPSSQSASCPAGTTSPYNDPQFDTQCETACAYLSSGNTNAVTTMCEVLGKYELIDVIASDCGACGNSSSSTPSTTASTTAPFSTRESSIYNLCTRLTSTHVYARCMPYNGSCESGYTFYDSYPNANSCGDAAKAWMRQYTKSSR